ncbi:MAG: hypothetical protein V9E98_11950 [Candidatus Nanopelagicales bacterium]
MPKLMEAATRPPPTSLARSALIRGLQGDQDTHRERRHERDGGVRVSARNAGPGQVHGGAGRLRGRDDLVVAHRSPRLDHGGHPGIDQNLQAVGKREERV